MIYNGSGGYWHIIVSNNCLRNTCDTPEAGEHAAGGLSLLRLLLNLIIHVPARFALPNEF